MYRDIVRYYPRLCRHLTTYILYLFSFSYSQENEWYQHIDATTYQIAYGNY